MARIQVGKVARTAQAHNAKSAGIEFLQWAIGEYQVIGWNPEEQTTGIYRTHLGFEVRVVEQKKVLRRGGRVARKIARKFKAHAFALQGKDPGAVTFVFTGDPKAVKRWASRIRVHR